MAADVFSLDAARAAAERNELGGWVAEFLASPGSDNAALGASLSASHRWWIGPIELPLDRLERLAGPSGSPALVVVEEDEWRDDVEDLADKVADGLQPPPVVVTYRDGHLNVEDGNHRLEALRRARRTEAWAVVGFEREHEVQEFMAQLSDGVS